MRRRRFLMRGRHLAGGHLEGGEQRRGAVALVIVAVAGQRPAVGELQIALRPLQRLDRGLLVDADDDRVLRRRHVEPDHVGGLGDELGIVALAPGLAPGEVDLLGAQEAPDILHVDVAQRGCNQRPGPARKPGRRRALQNRQDAASRLGRCIWAQARARLVDQTGQALPRETATPVADRSRHRADRPGNRPRRAALRSQQHDPRAKDIALLRRRCPHPRFKHRTILRRQPDLRCFGNHPKVKSRVSLP